MKAMANHRTYSVEFKRQIVQDFMAGETLHTLARRHDISRNLVRLWVRKFEAGAFDDDVQAADLLQDYEAKITALELRIWRSACCPCLPPRSSAAATAAVDHVKKKLA